MDVVHERCAGLDVHKKLVWACVTWLEAGQKRKAIRRFLTTTNELLAMVDWLKQQGATHIAMEATGVYWRPVWTILEGQFELLLVNPQHVKAIPGRKTDAKDCEWLADLLQHGLLRGSFVPATEIQDLRDLTRYRVELVQAQNRCANRIQKVLEQANIKLSSVASDTLGASGRKIIEAILAEEQDAGRLADLAQGRLRRRIAELETALHGRIRQHHRFMLREHYNEWIALGQKIQRVEQEIEKQIVPFEQAVTLWLTIPGVNRVTAWTLVAEMGTNMDQFPSPQHLASWAGMCPGNHQSAGKRLSGTTRDGNRWLRRALCQVSWAISRKKNCYLTTQFKRLAARLGLKRAIVAVGHSVLIIAYTMLKATKPYREVEIQLEHHHREKLQKSLIRKLNSLGLTVTVQPA